MLGRKTTDASLAIVGGDDEAAGYDAAAARNRTRNASVEEQIGAQAALRSRDPRSPIRLLESTKLVGYRRIAARQHTVQGSLRT